MYFNIEALSLPPVCLAPWLFLEESLVMPRRQDLSPARRGIPRLIVGVPVLSGGGSHGGTAGAGGFRTCGLPVGLVSRGPIPQDFRAGTDARLP